MRVIFCIPRLVANVNFINISTGVSVTEPFSRILGRFPTDMSLAWLESNGMLCIQLNCHHKNETCSDGASLKE